MILPSESDMTYQCVCGLSYHVLLGVQRDFSLTWYEITYRIES